MSLPIYRIVQLFPHLHSEYFHYTPKILLPIKGHSYLPSPSKSLATTNLLSIFVIAYS